ncbi:hypothetical protein GGI12_001207 [Dipsacomyces acuminosporus]|nr:hypothetical protein GGI12_001207 [Dipsacomyces acuminosporus]
MNFVNSLVILLLAVATAANAQAPPLPIPPILNINGTVCLTLSIVGITLINIKTGECAPAVPPFSPLVGDQEICRLIHMVDANPKDLNVVCSDNANLGFITGNPGPACLSPPDISPSYASSSPPLTQGGSASYAATPPAAFNHWV